jgi:hypothetical protein
LRHSWGKTSFRQNGHEPITFAGEHYMVNQGISQVFTTGIAVAKKETAMVNVFKTCLTSPALRILTLSLAIEEMVLLCLLPCRSQGMLQWRRDTEWNVLLR